MSKIRIVHYINNFFAGAGGEETTGMKKAVPLIKNLGEKLVRGEMILDPDLVVPLDVLRYMEQEGVIGELADYFITTTGTGTSTGNSKTIGAYRIVPAVGIPYPLGDPNLPREGRV